MNDGPNDSEFVEIHVDAAPPPEEAEAPAPAEAATEAPASEAEGDKPEGKPKPEGDGDDDGDKDKPLRDDNGRFKGGAPGRINELTRARREAERAAEYWKGIATRNGAQPGSDAAPTSEPNPDDFDDYAEFVKASARWAYADEQRKSIDSRVTEAAAAVETHRAAEWTGKIAAAKAAIPDFDAVMETADTPTLPHVAEAIMDADRGPELLYHLASNPEVVARLNDMSPNRAAMELGRIEATLAAPAAAPAPPPPPRETTQSKAPAPITPVQPGSTVAKDPSKMSMDEYKAFRTAQGIR